jgi:two-component system chemotaxis response regulator CheY
MFKPETRFLIIDDFSTMRKALKSTLNMLGYKNVVEAVDGKNAVDKLQDNLEKNTPIDFILSDWTMPNMSGIELLKYCKQQPQFQNLPFILITAESEQGNIVEALKSGVSEYIVKPFNPQLLKTKMEKVYTKVSDSQKKVA